MPRPIPEKEWIVIPPTLQAAMPVEAVTATASAEPLCLRFSEVIISRKRTDFPVPTGVRCGGQGSKLLSRRSFLTSGSCEEDVLPL